MKALLHLLFGCAHPRTTFPQSRGGAHFPRCYVVCLCCGREFEYDWQHMRIGKPVEIDIGRAQPRKATA